MALLTFVAPDSMFVINVQDPVPLLYIDAEQPTVLLQMAIQSANVFVFVCSRVVPSTVALQ